MADENELVFALALPIFIVNGKTLTAEMKNMAAIAFLEPKNAFSAKYGLGNFVVEKILKLANCKRAIALERNRRETINSEMVGRVVMVMVVFVPVEIVTIVPVKIVMVVMVVMVVPVEIVIVTIGIVMVVMVVPVVVVPVTIVIVMVVVVVPVTIAALRFEFVKIAIGLEQTNAQNQWQCCF